MYLRTVFLSVLLASPAFASEVDCKDKEVSAQVDECVSLDFNAADKELNEAYKNLTIKISDSYKRDAALGKEFLNVIKLSQLAWIKFRDTNCAAYAFQIENGTQAYKTTSLACSARMSRERTQELLKLYQNL